MHKLFCRLLSAILIIVLLLTLFLTPAQQVKAAEEVKYSDLFYVYASGYLKSTLLTSHSKEIGGLTSRVYNEYCDSPSCFWTAVKDGLMAATDLSEFRKLMTDTYGDTDYNYEASLDNANVLLASQLLNCYDDLGLVERFLDGLTSFAEICELFEEDIVREELKGIGIVIELFERVREAQLWDKEGKISTGRIEIKISEDPDLSAMLSNASDAYDLGRAIVISMMMENIRLELIDDIIANAPQDSAIYEGMSRLRSQLYNGGYSYFYETYLKPEVVDKITDTIKELPLKADISFLNCYNIVTSLVRIAATVVFDVVFDVPGRDDMTTQFILNQYSTDLYLMLVNTQIPKFDGQFSHKDITSFENVFVTYIAASNAALAASEPLLLDSNTIEYNRVVAGWSDIGYEDFIESSYYALESISDEQRDRKFFENWSVKADEVFVAPSDEVKENCIYVENETFPGNLTFPVDYKLKSDVNVAGNVHVSDEAVLKLPSDRTMRVSGDLKIDGYLINTNTYYKTYYAQLDNDGTIHVEGDFIVGEYGIYRTSSSAKLYLAGDYNAYGTANQYTHDSLIILNGNTQQKLTNFSAGNVTVTNTSGIKYCSNAYIYGHYALNGNPLEVGEFSTYMYDGTTFDSSYFHRVTVGSTMQLRSNVKADVVFAKNGEIVLSVAQQDDYIIDGNMLVEGYLIDTSTYYRAYPATLSIAGILRVTGNLEVGSYANLEALSTMVLHVAGSYNVSSYLNISGTVVFDGSQQQSIKGLSALNVLVSNSAGIKYLSDAYVRGYYALNNNPLELNGYSTYMYETTVFDKSDFGQVTVSGSMTLNTNVKANVIFSKNGEIVLSVAEGSDHTIDGNLTVEGYLINTSSYYRAYPATLSVGGTLRITGDLAAISYANLEALPNMMLYVTGNYNVSSYSNVSGTVIFDGSQQQTVRGLTAQNVRVLNKAGIKYLSNAYVLGNYALSANPLDRNGFTTYMYETTRFDSSDFDHVTIAGSMTLNTGVKADVELAKNGSVTITVPEDANITIDGDLTVDGYLIDTSSYYRGYPAYLYLNGTLRITGNFAVGTYGNFCPAESSVLYVGGNYYVSSYGSTGGTVVFNGKQKQTSSLLRCDKLLLENTSADGVSISSMICTRLFDHQSNVFTFTNSPNCADYDRDGIRDHLDPEPTLKAGCVAENAVVLYENGVVKASYSTFAEALREYDPAVHYLQLAADLVAVGELTRDVYIDLAGFDLSGILYTDGNSVVLMDSATDGYSCDNMGYFTCVDEEDTLIEPQMHWKTDEARFGSVKRYLTVADETGFSAHRFYLGITHVTMKPNTNGMGYKAVFAGDEMVQSMVDSYGFTLALGNFTPKTFAQQGTFISEETVTLRIENYDVDSYGEAQLKAQVFLTIGGELICSNEYSSSLREAMETVNDNVSLYSQAQLSALKAMIECYAVMQTWKTDNILAAA